jgi:hypothetical protein
MVADPPHRAPIPLSKVADNPLVQPIGGAALIVLGRSKPRSPQADAISFHPARVDLGNLPGTGWEASKLKHHHVEVTNTSDHPVVIRSIKSTCGCLLPMTGLGILRPKESRKIPFAVLPGSWGPGDRHQLLMLTCADESTAHLRVDGRGIVPDDVPGKEQGLEP